MPTPNGGGQFVFATHSLVAASGIVGYYSALASFTPTSKAGDISGGLWKGGVQGSNFSAFYFVNLNGQASTNLAYILGLSAAEPAHLTLIKGQLASGVPDVAPGAQGVLLRSTATYASKTWLHVKLEAILEPNGDVVLNVYTSDLTANAITAPVWVLLFTFTDDALGINSGTVPLTSGRMGWAMQSSDVNRIGAFDQVVTDRQILP